MKKQELDYYEEFIKMSKYTIDISSLLKELVQGYDYDKVGDKVIEIHEIENMADKTQHGVLNYLIRDFVPPIDREDIINLTRRLDDVIDSIDEVSIDLDIFVVRSLRSNMTEYMEILEEASKMMHELLMKFKDMKDYDGLKKIVVEVNNIEEKGDKLFQKSIKELYESGENAIDVNRWTIIYSKLEDCFDAIEHIADCVEEIFMKNS